MMGPPFNEPPAPYCYQMRLYLTWNQPEKAQALLDSLNKCQRAFGGTAFDMPEPIVGPMEGLDICPATRIVERDLRFTMELQAKRRAA